MTYHAIKDINTNELPNTLAMASKMLMANIHTVYDDFMEDHDLDKQTTEKVLLSLKGLAIIQTLRK